MKDRSKKLTDEEVFKIYEDAYSVYSKVANKKLGGNLSLLKEFQSSSDCKFQGPLKGILKTRSGERKLVISRDSVFHDSREEIVDLPSMDDFKQITKVSKAARLDVRVFLYERNKRELEIMRGKLKHFERMKKDTQKRIEVLEKRMKLD